MIGRLKGVPIHKAPPWAKRRACEALPRALLSARPSKAGPGLAEAMRLRHGWLREAAP
jgi:hypothetical protein